MTKQQVVDSWNISQGKASVPAVRRQQVPRPRIPSPGFQKGLLPRGAEARSDTPSPGRRESGSLTANLGAKPAESACNWPRDLRRRWRARADAEEETRRPQGNNPDDPELLRHRCKESGARGRHHEGDAGLKSQTRLI